MKQINGTATVLFGLVSALAIIGLVLTFTQAGSSAAAVAQFPQVYQESVPSVVPYQRGSAFDSIKSVREEPAFVVAGQHAVGGIASMEARRACLSDIFGSHRVGFGESQFTCRVAAAVTPDAPGRVYPEAKEWSSNPVTFGGYVRCYAQGTVNRKTVAELVAGNNRWQLIDGIPTCFPDGFPFAQ